MTNSGRRQSKVVALLQAFAEHWEFYVYGLAGITIGTAAIFGFNLNPETLSKVTLMILALLLVTLGLALKRFHDQSRLHVELSTALTAEQSANATLKAAVTEMGLAMRRLEHRDASDVLKDISPHDEIARILTSGRSFVLIGETLFNVLNTWEMLIVDALRRGCDFVFLFTDPSQLPPQSLEETRALHTVKALVRLAKRVDDSAEPRGSILVLHPPSRLMCSAFAVDHLETNGLIRVQPFLLFPDSSPVKKGHFDLFADCSRHGWFAHYQEQVQSLLAASKLAVMTANAGTSAQRHGVAVANRASDA